MHGIRYRSDIDGLRTVAVLPVILFHFGVWPFTGGYVGVDVFFVISGFLITAGIVNEIDGMGFSILAFYERRVRRIFPALFAMIAATLIAGYALFMPDEFKDLGASAAAAALFASNFLFWRTADYFAGPVELKPLIHTWSLAVEEQYYILLPLFLAAVARWGGRRYAKPTLVLAALSLALSVAGLWLAPTGTYYLLPTRAWELLVGSLLAERAVPRIGTQRRAELAAAAGAAMILGSAVLLDDASRFPGYNALWPCIGAGLILHAGTHHVTRVGRLLGTRAFVFLGLVSYSLYLWHWPLLVFAKYQAMRDLTAVETIALLAATLVVSVASWRFVERPFRSKRVGRRAILSGGVAAIVAVSLAGGIVFAKGGLPRRFGDPARFAHLRVPGEPRPGEPVCFLQGGFGQWAGDACFLTRGPGRNVLLWGDSHAAQYVDALRANRMGLSSSVLMLTSAGCPPILDVDVKGRPDCRANNAHVFDVVRRYGIRRVVLSGHWEYLMVRNGIPLDALARTVARLRAAGVEVVIVGDNPDYAFNNPQFLSYRLSKRADPDAPFSVAPRNDWTVNAKLAAIAGPGMFFDPLAALCRGHRCLVYANGGPLMSDNAHLSDAGAALVAARMAPLLR